MSDTSTTHNSFTEIVSREVEVPYVECEAIVRAEFPSAPRRVQVMLAGAAFLGSMDADEQTVEGLTLLERRYSGARPTPYREALALDDESLAIGTPDAKEEFWERFDSSLGARLAQPYNQPDFLVNIYDANPGTSDSISVKYMWPLAAEPLRTPDVHPDPPYSDTSLRAIYEESYERHHKFWQYAELEEGVFQGLIMQVLAQYDAGKDVYLGGPKGVGKSNFFIPKLLAQLQRQGIAATYGFQEDLTQTLRTAIAEQSSVIVVDEPATEGKEVAIQELLQQSPQLRVISIVGVAHQVEVRRRLITRLSNLSASAGREIFEHEIDALPLLSEASIRRWAQENQADSELTDFILGQPLLRVARVFDDLFNGGIRDPKAKIEKGDSGTKEERSNFIHGREVEARGYQISEGWSRVPMHVRTMSDLQKTIDAKVGSRRPYGQRYYLERIVAHATDLTGIVYEAYQELCEALKRPAKSIEAINNAGW